MSLFINGVSIESMSASIIGLSGWLDGPVMLRETSVIANVLGSAPAGFSTTNTREISVKLYFRATSLADRDTLLTKYYDAISGLVKLSFMENLNRYVRVVAVKNTVQALSETSAFFAFPFIVTTSFVAYDPSSYDAEPRVVSFSSTPAPIVIGSSPSPGVIFLTGAQAATVSRVVTYRSFNGIPFGSMTLTPPTGESLGSTEFVEMTLLRRTLVKVAGSTRTSVYHWKTGGAWFTPQPNDCDRVRNMWPTLSTDVGNGSYVYRLAWAL